MDASHPAVAMIQAADKTWARYADQYERLMSKWGALRAKREALIAELMATRSQPAATAEEAAAPAVAAAVPAATASAPAQDLREEIFGDPFATPGYASATPVSPATPAESPFASPSGAQPGPAAPADGGASSPDPAPVRKTPSKLTVPNVMGVSGASIIITATILWIAVAWETFSPFALGSMVLLTSVFTAALGWWLTKIDLPISGGAVGVVAAAIAGISALGYDRGSDALGAYEVPAAATVAALSGVGLSRLGLRWVGPSASIALMVAVLSGTIARTAAETADKPAAFGIAGAALGGIALATYPLWRSAQARGIVRWTSVAWVGIATNVAAWTLAADGVSLPRALGAALGVAVLVAAAVAWPKSTLPAAVAAVVGAGINVGLDIGPGWHVATGAAVAVALVSVAAMVVPERFRAPLTWALWLGAAVIVAVAVGTAVTGLDRSLQVWTTPFEPATVLHAGIAATAGAAALALLERAVGKGAGRVTAGVGGAFAASVGLAALAFAAIERANLSPTFGVVIALVAGALAAAATIPLWMSSAAKWTAAIVAVTHGTIAGAVATVALANGDEPLGRGIAAVAIPVVALVAFGIKWPRPTLPSAAAILTGLGAAVPAAYGLVPVSWLTGSAAVVAILVWAASVLPRSHARPALVGAAPAGLLGAVAVVIGAPMLATVVLADFGTNSTVLVQESLPWWAAGVAAAVAVAALGARRIVATDQRDGTDLIGALATIALGLFLSAGLIEEWYALGVPATAGATLGALAMAASLWVWRSRTARWTAGIGALAWLTIAHTRGFTLFGDGPGELIDWVAVLVATVLILVGAGYWWPRATGGPAAFLVTFGAFATAHATIGGIRAWAVLAISLAVVAWAVVPLGTRRALGARAGLTPAAAVIAGHMVYLWSGEYAVTGDDRWWEAGLLAAAYAAALSFPELRRHAAWLSLPFALTAAIVSPAVVAWVGLTAVAVLLVAIGPRARHTAPTALAYVVAASFWAGQESGWLAIVAGVAAALAYAVAVRHDEPERTWALIFGPVALGFSIGAALATAGAHMGFAAGAAMLAATAASFASTRPPLALDPQVARVQTAAFTGLAPFFAGDSGAAGWIFVAGALVWLTIAVRGWDPGKWAFAAGMTIGPLLIAADAEVGAVEAYSVVPAAAFIGLGLWELAKNPFQRTFVALAPGLAVALVPSIVALGVDVNNLPRTLGLTAAVLVLALWGVAARWFAPILATLVSAVWVSLTQLFAGTDLVPRWVSLLFVGAIVMVTGATYERLKALR